MSGLESEETRMVLSGVNFNADKDVLYTKPKVNANSGKSVGILNAHTKKSMFVSTPLMLTWGANCFEDEKTGKKTYDMSLQFPNKDYPNEESEKFLENMQKLEAKFKADAITNCKEWMNKAKLSADVIDALWTPMLRYPKDKDTGEPDYSRAPTLRIKIPYWDEKFTSEIYDLDQKKLFPTEDSVDEVGTLMALIPKAINIATLIQCGGLWFANGKFGVTWKLFQAVVKPKQNMRGICHVKLSDKDREMASLQDKEEEEEDMPGKSSSLVVDSDDDEPKGSAINTQPITSEDEEPAVEEKIVEAAQDPPKKKVVRKKSVSKLPN